MEGKFFADSTSIISADASIGSDTRVWQFCNIMPGAIIGEKCNIGQGCYIEGGVTIGNHVTVKNNVALYDGVICSDNIFLGPNCVFTNVKFPRSFVSRKDEFLATVLDEGVTIGANVTVVCGVHIGKYAMIGAGSVVTKDVEPYALMVGNPANKIGYVCQCGEKLPWNGNVEDDVTISCNRCHKGYHYNKKGLTPQLGRGRK